MQYISVLEYLGSTPMSELSTEQLANMNTLVPNVNALLEAFGSYRKCNSGFRSYEQHARIYDELNAKRISQGFKAVPIPLGSQHLRAAAIDIEDTNGKFYSFCLANESLLKKLGLYCENRQGGWQHLQIFAPKSGSRWFNPY